MRWLCKIREIFYDPVVLLPDVEKDFEDYDLGLMSMNLGDTFEVVEAYLSDEELTEVGDAIDIVTKEKEKNERIHFFGCIINSVGGKFTNAI